jgi:DNA-binding FadR family transcriptional regulator
MPIQAIESQKIYRQIADQLASLIASGELEEGSRLPSERELAALLGVSRPSVRGGLIALTLEGKVEMRGRSGVFVTSARVPARPRPVAVPPLPTSEELDELVRSRWVVEGEIAMEAAGHARPGDVDALREAVDAMAACHREQRDADEADRLFHLGIARATQNSPLISVAEKLWAHCRGRLWQRVERHFQAPEVMETILDDHRRILRAIELRDARGAREAMHRHLEHVDREFHRAWRQ